MRRPGAPRTYTLAELATLAGIFDGDTRRLAAALGADDAETATRFVDWIREHRPRPPGRPRGRRDSLTATARNQRSAAQQLRRERERAQLEVMPAAA